MDLSPATLDDAVAAYPDHQPLSAVERDHLALLPETFADGDYGWRTVEWVVQWYYRRFLGAYPDADRRESEAAFDDNGYDAVHDAVAGMVGADRTAEKLDRITALDGVDVAVGSAFLAFAHPDRFVVVGPYVWRPLREAGRVDGPLPDPLSVADHERYLAACRSLRERDGRSPWDLYRALWVLGEAEA